MMLGTMTYADGKVQAIHPRRPRRGVLHVCSGKPTRYFLWYVRVLALRIAVLVLGAALLVLRPEMLDISTNFGPRHPLSYPNLVFLLMCADMTSKMLPRAHIALGSLKQYRSFHAPTVQTFRGGARELAGIYADSRAAFDELYSELRGRARQLLRMVDVLPVVPIDDEDLTANRQTRLSILESRLR